MKNNILIGLGSKARVGKDFACAGLARYFDVERIAFADKLKEDIASLFNNHGLVLRDILEVPATKEMVRPLLVSYGQTMRAFNNDIWVDRALKDKEFKHAVTVITDVRFPNEAKRIRELGGYYIEIDANIPPANEVEALYSPQMVGIADYVIKNSFDGKFIQDFVKLIEKIRDNG
jgi:hypothetical protein